MAPKPLENVDWRGERGAMRRMAGIYEVREENRKLFAGQPCDSVLVESLHVKASTNYLVTEIELSQKFVAVKESKAVVYRLPIDEHAAVYKFSVRIHDRTFEGEITSTAKAIEIYNQQRDKGYGAYVVREDAEDMFEILLGRVVKDAPVEVSVTFVTQLSIRPAYDENGQARPALQWVLPMTANQSMGNKGAEVDVGMDFTMPSNILTVTLSSLEGSFSHKRKETRATATLKGNVNLQKDMTVDVLLDTPRDACMVLESDPEHTPVACVMMLPWTWKGDVSTEFVFVVHMPKAQPRTVCWMTSALERGLQVVRSKPGCRCNIVRVGKDVKFLNREHSVPNDEQWKHNQEEFIAQHLNLESAGSAGDLKDALEMVFGRQVPASVTHRQVLLLSNGGVDRPGEILQLVRQQQGSTRCFSMGFGSDPKLHQLLLRGVARNGRGTAFFVSRQDRIEHDMAWMISDAAQPAMTNVRIEWQLPQQEAAAGQAAAQQPDAASQGPPSPPPVPRLEDFDFVQTPFHPPPLLPGASLVSYTLLPRAGNGRAGPVPESCTISWRLTGEEQDRSMVLRVDSGHWENGLKFHRLAAKSFIRDLEQRESKLHATPLDLTGLQTVEAIAQCANSFSLVSSQTAFIASHDLSEHLLVRHQQVLSPDSGSPDRQAQGSSGRRHGVMHEGLRSAPASVRVRLPARIGGLVNASSDTAQKPVAFTLHPQPIAATHGAGTRGTHSSPYALKWRPQGRARLMPRSVLKRDGLVVTFHTREKQAQRVTKEAVRQQKEELSALLKAHNADTGEFILRGSHDSSDLASALGRKVDMLVKAWTKTVPEHVKSKEKDERLRLWGTALALEYLWRECAAVEDDWKPIADKSQKWLSGQLSEKMALELHELAASALVGM